MGRVGFNPVVAKHGNTFTSLRRTRRARRLKAMRAHVYFVQDGAGMVKIGYARNVYSRFANLRVSNASELKMLVHAPGDSVAEERLHSAFARHRRAGEWFSPAPELMAFIEELKAAIDWWEPST